MPSITVGKVLIQRDEESYDKRPIYYYKKFPPRIAEKTIFLVDPMLGTAGSVNCCIKELLKSGVKEEAITFVNLIGCEIGLENLYKTYPNVKTLCCKIDPYLLTDVKYLAPGLGDYGCRFFGTDGMEK